MQELLMQIIGKIDEVNRKVGEMDQRFEAIDQRFEAIDRRFEEMDQRFEAIDWRFETIDRRFEAMDRKFDAMNHELLDVKSTVHRMEAKLSATFEQVVRVSEDMTDVKEKIWHIDRRLAEVELEVRG